MIDNNNANEYEEARKKRLEENKRKFEDLGINKISKSLVDLSNSEKKPQQRFPKPRSHTTYVLEPRRSTRARNPVPSYRDDVGVELPTLRKRSRSYSSSWASYLARPLDEVKSPSFEERAGSLRAAEELQKSLQSGNPSFIKSMGLPSSFCENNLPKKVVDVVLEDENGAEYDAVYIGTRSGLSGGWRAFALDHRLDDGDAVVFEQVEPTRFKVYIVRASSVTGQVTNGNAEDKNAFTDSQQKAKRIRKLQNTAMDTGVPSAPQQLKQESEEKPKGKKSKTGIISQKIEKKSKAANSGKPNKKATLEKEPVRRSARKKAAK